MKITISKENYLKTIAEAESEGETVIAATLARWLNVSAPAVTMAIKRLKRDDLIQVGAEGQLSLTATGREIAARILQRHHLIERMLTEVFGMEWYKVHDEAERLEHAVSEDFERKLLDKLGSSEECPHGNRAIGNRPEDRRTRGLQPLSEMNDETAGQVVSIFERDRKLLEYLNGVGIEPGIFLEVISVNYDATLTLKVNDAHVQIGKLAADKIWVDPVKQIKGNLRLQGAAPFVAPLSSGPSGDVHHQTDDKSDEEQEEQNLRDPHKCTGDSAKA